MYQHLTKLLLAGGVAVILTVGPAHAFHKRVVHGSGGGGDPIQTLDSLSPCTPGQVPTKQGDGSWLCADVVDAGPRTVFVTSGVFTGDLRSQGGALTGLRGGDEICQAEAEDGVVPPGHYIAWLSTFSKDAKDRLPANTNGYFLPSGIKVADDKTDLLDGTLDHAIDENAFGVLPPGVPTFANGVWTGSFGAGGHTTDSCDNWTDSTAGFSGTVGDLSAADSSWTNSAVVVCAFFGPTVQHLYCFQR